MTGHSSAAAVSGRPNEAEAEVERVVAGFMDGTLPHAEWTHRAHLTVALWFATHHESAEALDRIRAGILRLNAAHGVPTTPTRGYHETITRFYMHVVGRFVEHEGREGDWAERVNRLLTGYGHRDLPLRYYSEARLKSAEARAGWVEADIRALP